MLLVCAFPCQNVTGSVLLLPASCAGLPGCQVVPVPPAFLGCAASSKKMRFFCKKFVKSLHNIKYCYIFVVDKERATLNARKLSRATRQPGEWRKFEKVMKATRENIQRVRTEVENSKQRSAWGRGVQAYALNLLDDFEEWADWRREDGKGLLNIDERTALNGAKDWEQWAFGGCGLCYDAYIAERLCTPSELRKTRGGMFPPSGANSWLLVEARAVRQAWAMIAATVRRLESKEA